MEITTADKAPAAGPVPGQPNGALLVALARKQAEGARHWQVAYESQIHPTQLSLVLNGHRRPSREQGERIAHALGEPVDVLFPYLRERAEEDRPRRVRKSGDETTDLEPAG